MARRYVIRAIPDIRGKTIHLPYIYVASYQGKSRELSSGAALLVEQAEKDDYDAYTTGQQ